MIVFADGWRDHTVNHLKSEVLARGLIRNAAVALAESPGQAAIMFWIEAAQGGAGVLNVTKGPHQPKGVSNQVLHLRMRLYIKGSKEGSLKYENTAFATDFHLYTTILNPNANPDEYQLQPTELTYKTAWHAPSTAAYTSVAIVGARILTNNL